MEHQFFYTNIFFEHLFFVRKRNAKPMYSIKHKWISGDDTFWLKKHFDKELPALVLSKSHTVEDTMFILRVWAVHFLTAKVTWAHLIVPMTFSRPEAVAKCSRLLNTFWKNSLIQNLYYTGHVVSKIVVFLVFFLSRFWHTLELFK